MYTSAKLLQKPICILISIIFIATNNVYSLPNNNKKTLRVPLQTKGTEIETKRSYPLEIMDTKDELSQAVKGLRDDKIGIKKILIAYCMGHPEEEDYALEIAKEKNIHLDLITERLKDFVDANGHISIVAADQGTFIEWTEGNKENPDVIEIARATLFRLKMLYYYASQVKAAGNTSIGFLTDLPTFECLENISFYNIRGFIEGELLPSDFLTVVKAVPLVMQMEDTRGKRGLEYKDSETPIFHTALRRDNITVRHAKELGAKMVKSNIFLYIGETLTQDEKDFNNQQWEFVKVLAMEAKQQNMPYVSEVLFMPPVEKTKDKTYVESKEYLEAHALSTIETAKIMDEIDGITLCKLAHPYPGQAGWNNTTAEQRQAKLQELKMTVGNKWLILSAGENMDTFDQKVLEAANYGGAVGMLVGRSPIKDVVAKDDKGVDRLKKDSEVIPILQTSAQDKMRNLISHFDNTPTSIWKIRPEENPFYESVYVHPNREIMGRKGGKEAWDRISSLLNATNRDISIVLASAPSQVEFLTALASEIIDAYNNDEVSQEQLRRIHIFHLDQYTGLLDKPEKYHEKCDFAKFLATNFLNLLPKDAKDAIDFHPIRQTKKGLQGDALLTAARDECSRYYEEEILPVIKQNNGNFDIVVFGIGDENAHIAFIEPENADIKIKDALIPVKVHPAQQVSDGMFDTIEDVPMWAITMTLDRLINNSDYMIGIIPTGTKDNSVKAMLEGKITNERPASFVRIRKHGSITIHLTEKSARKLHQEILIKYEPIQNRGEILKSAIEAQERLRNAYNRTYEQKPLLFHYVPKVPKLDFASATQEEINSWVYNKSYGPPLVKSFYTNNLRNPERTNKLSISALKALTNGFSILYASYFNQKAWKDVSGEKELYFLGDDVENNPSGFEYDFIVLKKNQTAIIVAKDNEQKNKIIEALDKLQNPANLKIILLKDILPVSFNFNSAMNKYGYGFVGRSIMRFVTDKEIRASIKDDFPENSGATGITLNNFHQAVCSI